MEKLKKIHTVDSSEGKKIALAGGSYRIVVSGKQTGGEYAIIEMSVPPGAGANPHAHTAIVETFYVLEGEISFQSEVGNYKAQKGASVNIPKGGLVHAFKNKTHKEAKLLCTVMPAGLDDCFVEVSDYLTNNSEASEIEKKTKLVAIAEKYGNQVFPLDYFDN